MLKTREFSIKKMEPETKKSTNKRNRNNNGEKEGVKYMK
jgi:hypothetical protein